MTEPTVNNSNNTVTLCYKSDGAIAITMCRHCGQEFCNQHRSRYDSRFCCDCVSEETIKFEEQPLVDDEGVTHQGRIIKLIGEGWPYHLQMLQDLTDEQLDFKIAETRRLLNECIKTGEFFRITLCAAEFEKEDRYRSKIRKLRERRKAIEQGAINLNNRKTRVAAKKDPAEQVAASLGITVEQARQLISITKGAKQ